MNEVSFYKDVNLSYIFNYKFIPFEDNGKDTGFMIRTIELYKLAKMKDSIKKFTEITGFNFDNLIPSAEEIKLLIKRGRSVISNYSKFPEKEEAELKSLVDILNNSQNGKISKPAGYHLSSRVWITDMHHAVERKKDSIKSEKNKLDKMNGLYGLLYPVIEWLFYEKITGFKKELLESIPRETVNLNALLSEMDWEYSNACKLIISAMDELERCVNKVINQCATPTGKYTLHHTPVYQSDYYKLYYGKESHHLKHVLTADEYVDAMVNAKNRIQDKLKYM
ncbi:hypothetical protein KKJ09_06420 [Xenorhabdus bovienii]|uniref:hypothetical protein n=1 Tax=Xenorhabdus bovienii TaxID=40576 RepID=UPI0023B279CF|nr:hypothetical protein [Xenorhabdus bovienii]MDE9493242.1 hypothetical protein [Xenorhabdus bovienii]MDE9501778.1 hypothetical protein [Xenorhabdus bovienii]MDE9525562.1 hypothetical protein [Xenorhabdus bovienii]MDE9568001.1 hypothetical protein [Xenorhabdus bovienii]